MRFTIFLNAAVVIAGGLTSASAPSVDLTDSGAVGECDSGICDSLNVIMDKAKAGDAGAMNEVGVWYYLGRHVDRDYVQAYEWWKKSALKSHVRAIANLGMCYQLGHGVERDSVDAMRLYKKSIRDGNSPLFQSREANASKSVFDAMLAGDCYENGVGVKKDYAKAVAFYACAAAAGSADGMRQAGICCLNAKDNARALEYFRQGASRGDLSSMYWSGKMLLEGMGVPSDSEPGVVYMLKAAEGGMAAARTEMGILYSEGRGVVRNPAQAADWWHKAASQGHPYGMWQYGNAMKDGFGVPQDYDQALFWMAEAVPAGYQRAFRSMVSRLDSVGGDPFLSYLRGMRLYLVEGDMKGAAAQFKKVEKAGPAEGKIMQAVILASKRNENPNAGKAAKMLSQLKDEDAEAAFYLASLYEIGNGVDQHMQKAIELYRMSADMGYGPAQSYLGDIYYEGRCVEKNLITAVELYKKAYDGRRLSERGAVRLAECYENGLAGLAADKKKAAALRKEKRQSNLTDVLKEVEIKTTEKR